MRKRESSREGTDEGESADLWCGFVVRICGADLWFWVRTTFDELRCSAAHVPTKRKAYDSCAIQNMIIEL